MLSGQPSESEAHQGRRIFDPGPWILPARLRHTVSRRRARIQRVLVDVSFGGRPSCAYGQATLDPGGCQEDGKCTRAIRMRASLNQQIRDFAGVTGVAAISAVDLVAVVIAVAVPAVVGLGHDAAKLRSYLATCSRFPRSALATLLFVPVGVVDVIDLLDARCHHTASLSAPNSSTRARRAVSKARTLSGF